MIALFCAVLITGIADRHKQLFSCHSVGLPVTVLPLSEPLYDQA